MWKRGWIKRGNGQTEEQKENQSGLAEGKKNGLAEGEAKRTSQTENQNGLAEGERAKQLEIAKNLIKLGLNIDDIVKATELSKEEIEKLTEDK